MSFSATCPPTLAAWCPARHLNGTVTVIVAFSVTCCIVASNWCRFVPNVPPTSLSLPPSPSLAALSPPIGVALCPTCHLHHCHCHHHHHLLHCRLRLVSLCAQRATYSTVTVTITCCTATCSLLLGAQRVTSQVLHSYRCPAGGVSKSSLTLPGAGARALVYECVCMFV